METYMIYRMSKGWLLNKFKSSIENHEDYIVESREAARFLGISVRELKESILKTGKLNGFASPRAYKVGNQYYFFINELHAIKA